MFGGRFSLLAALILPLAAGAAVAQTATRPAVVGIGELPDAMIFYVAHGGPDACGTG